MNEQQMRAGLDACVHCGFCLPACPTYLALEDENDSPRGRLVLMRALLDGRIAAHDQDAGRHLDQCLGCRGCETACPSGVPYGHLLESTRATMSEVRPLPLVARLVLRVFESRWLLRSALFMARVFRSVGLARLAARSLPPRLGFPAAMLASTARPAAKRWTPQGDDSRGPTAMLTGCVMEGLMPSLNRATERVLSENGYSMVDVPTQRCCGALHAHAGDAEAAKRLARANIAAFETSGAGFIAMNSAGCGAMCRDYAHLLADDLQWSSRAIAFSAKVRDASELLASAGPKPTQRASTPVEVAWDAPCHLEHGQRVIDAPLEVLRATGSISLRPLTDSNLCCGSAGIFNLTQPDVASRVLAAKLARIHESGATVVATANPGCLMQLGGGLLAAGSAVQARHPLELLDAAYADARSND